MTRAAASLPHLGHQTLRPIGVIRSELKSLDEAPRQGSEGAPDAWLEVETWAAEALHGLSAGDEILVITWFHKADRDIFQRNATSFGHRESHFPGGRNHFRVRESRFPGDRNRPKDRESLFPDS